MSIDFLITLFLVGGGFFLLIMGAILLYRQAEQSLQNRVLMVAVVAWLIFGIWYIVSFIQHGDLHDRILPLNRIIWGVVTGLATVAYPISVICPKWLRRVLVAIFMWVPIIVLAIYWGYHNHTGKGFEKYYSYQQLKGHWLDATIILRLILYSIVVGYNIVVLWLILAILPIYDAYVKNNYSDLVFNLKWLRVAAAFLIGATIVFTLNIFWFDWWTRLIFMMVDFPLWLLLLERAIFHKPFTHAKDFEVKWSWRRGWYGDYLQKELDGADEASISLAEDLIIRKLNRYMATNEPYTNSNLTRDDLAKALNTNRTTLLLAIKQLGFDSFQDYINRQRVERFKQLAIENPDMSIVSLSKLAGFSSRSTFYSYFKQIEGVLPSEYLKGKMP